MTELQQLHCQWMWDRAQCEAVDFGRQVWWLSIKRPFF